MSFLDAEVGLLRPRSEFILFLTSCCFPGTIRAILKRCGAAGSFGGVIFPFRSDRAKNPSVGMSTAAQRTATGEPAASPLATKYRRNRSFVLYRCDDAVWGGWQALSVP